MRMRSERPEPPRSPGSRGGRSTPTCSWTAFWSTLPADHRPARTRRIRRARSEEYRTRCVDARQAGEGGGALGIVHWVGRGYLTDEGQLLVETASGRRVVMAGDVVHLRHLRSKVALRRITGQDRIPAP